LRKSFSKRNRSKKVELLAKVYDHAKHAYKFGFRMLTLGWSDGSTFLPVSSVLLSSENKKNRITEATALDKRTVGYKRRQLSMQKGTSAMLELLKQAKNIAIPAKYVLYDSWFSSPSSIHAVKEIGYDVIAMVKNTPKMFFRYNGEDMSLIAIFNKNKKRRGRSRYLLSVMVDVVKDRKVIPAKVVYVRNRNRRKEYLCIISSDTKLDENVFPFLEQKRRIPRESSDLSHLFPRGILLILFILSLHHYFCAHKKNHPFSFLRTLFYAVFSSIFPSNFFNFP